MYRGLFHNLIGNLKSYDWLRDADSIIVEWHPNVLRSLVHRYHQLRETFKRLRVWSFLFKLIIGVQIWSLNWTSTPFQSLKKEKEKANHSLSILFQNLSKTKEGTPNYFYFLQRTNLQTDPFASYCIICLLIRTVHSLKLSETITHVKYSSVHCVSILVVLGHHHVVLQYLYLPHISIRPNTYNPFGYACGFQEKKKRNWESAFSPTFGWPKKWERVRECENQEPLNESLLFLTKNGEVWRERESIQIRWWESRLS